jgi:hypothetical protein
MEIGKEPVCVDHVRKRTGGHLRKLREENKKNKNLMENF